MPGRTENERLRKARDAWAAACVTPGSERRPVFATTSGLEIPRVGLACDVEDPEAGAAELPGRFPYTRGVHPTMYRGRFWTMRQYAGFSTARESNERYRALLAAGQTGLSVAFDLPTQMGYDADDPAALGEVGRVGVAISSVDDMAVLLDGLDLSRVTISMTINSTAPILLAMVLAVARTRGVPWDALGGTVQNDPLKEYLARGTHVVPPAAALRFTVDVIEFCTRHVPRWNPISISGYHVREAGSTAAQEIGFTLSNAVAYATAAVDRGLAFDEFAPRLSFFFNSHNHLLEEVAKFRAARRLWARLARERFGGNDESCRLRFHAQTAGSTLTAQQPDVNVARVTIQCLAAVLGGAQSLHANARDEALALPTEDSARLALRTQQVIAHESGVADSADPLGGSWLIEHLTDRLEEEAKAIIARIDALGGMVAALPSGIVQREIADAAYEAQRAIESGKDIVVGVNRFQVDDSAPVTLQRAGETAGAEQAAALKRLRETRDAAAVTQALDRVEQACRGTENVMPAILDALEARATLGEISSRWTRVFGRHRDSF